MIKFMNKIKKNGGVITSYLSCRPNSKKINFTSNQNEFIKSVKMLDDSFSRQKLMKNI